MLKTAFTFFISFALLMSASAQSLQSGFYLCESHGQIRNITSAAHGTIAFSVANNAETSVEIWKYNSFASGSDDNVSTLIPGASVLSGRWLKVSASGTSTNAANWFASGSTNSALSGNAWLNSLTATGTVAAANLDIGASGTAGLITLFDTDADHSASLSPNPTTTTDVNAQLPAAPVAGIVQATVSGVTNWVLSASTDIGAATATTASPGDNDTSVATTAFVTAAVSAGGGGALSHFYNSPFLGPTNTVTETTIFTNSAAIPANAIGTNKTYFLHIRTANYNTSGVAKNLTLKVYVNGSVVYQDTSNNLADSSTALPGILDMWVQAAGSTSAQDITIRHAISAAGASTTGVGEFGNNQQQTQTMGATGAADSTSAIGIGITMTLSATGACSVLAKGGFDEVH